MRKVIERAEILSDERAAFLFKMPLHVRSVYDSEEEERIKAANLYGIIRRITELLKIKVSYQEIYLFLSFIVSFLIAHRATILKIISNRRYRLCLTGQKIGNSA